MNAVRSTTQLDMPLFAIPKDHPNVRWLVGLLKARGWMTRQMILVEAGRTGGKYSERWVRALVSAAGAEIVKGQEGFNHLDNVTVEQGNHAADQSISQGQQMIEYGLAIRKAMHARIG